MWHEIRLRSLGVIADAELEFGPGLSVITGETGAGKTMVVTALGLLRGGRAEPALVRHGDTRARVEGLVDVSRVSEVGQILEETPGEVEDGHLLLARTVSGEGRSRAFAGGASVPAGVLGRISDNLVAVHGQSDQHRLLRPVAQRAALDRFAGDRLADLSAQYEPAYARLREVDASLEDLTTRARERARELDLLAHGLQEVDAVSPEPGEEEALDAEERRLAHADALARAAGQAHQAISGDEETATDGVDITRLAGQAQAVLNGVRQHDDELDALASRLDEVTALLGDLGTDLASYAESVDVDPERLAEVQQRRAALAALTRKYGPTLTDVRAWAQEATRRRDELCGDDDRIEALREESARLADELLSLADHLSTTRRKAADSLADAVGHELEALAMPHARVDVDITAPTEPTVADLGPHGYDQVEIRLAAGAGAPARPLNKGASGGELSRVMLALEVILAGHAPVPTLVFDEVDAGVGGKAAVEVGRRLAHLARHAQVLVVTHQPQVAAFADRHYRVLKADDGTVTTSGVHRLDDAGRVAELSRMLAGLEGSASAEAHARELLDLGASERASATGPTS